MNKGFANENEIETKLNAVIVTMLHTMTLTTLLIVHLIYFSVETILEVVVYLEVF